MAGVLGPLEETWTWLLQEVGRVLLRVRDLSGSAGDAWYVLVPETAQTVDARGTPVVVTTNIVFAGNAEVGLTVTLEGPGAAGVDMTMFVNVGSTQPSWAYAGVVAPDDEPLPSSLAFRLTTPASSPSNDTSATARIDTTSDGEARRAVRIGRADIPTQAVPATVSITPAALAAAAATLAAHGLSLTGLGLPAGGSGTVTVEAPAADTGAAALSNAAITSMTDVLATFATPGGGALGTAFWEATVEQVDNSAANLPSTTSLVWSASGVFDVVAALAGKDPAPRLGLTNRTSLVTANTTRLPSSLTVALATMPDIPYGGASPDPAAAAPALDYTANARLTKLDLVQIAQSTPVSPPPPGGTPPPSSSLRVVADDVPRHVTVRAGQWDPNHPDDTFLDLQLRNEAGNTDTLGHLAAAARDSMLPAPLLTPTAGQQLKRDAAEGTRQADILGLRALTLRVEPRAANTTLHVHYLAAAERPATVTLVDADLAATTVTATPLPTEVTIDAVAPDMATLLNAQASWSGSATWVAAATVPDLTVTRAAPPGASGQGLDEIAWNAGLKDFPRDITVTAGNDGASQVTRIEWLADTRLTQATADVHIVRYSQADEPFFDATVSAGAVPRGATVEIMRATAGLDIAYGGCDAVAGADVRVRNTALVTARDDQFVAFDHARAVLTGIPATVSDPQQVTAGPRLAFRLDTASGQGLLALVDVPAGIDPIGLAHVHVVDAAAGDAQSFPTAAGVRWVNRPALGPQGDDLPGAPAGSQFAVTLPQLRHARYDGRDGQSMPPAYTIARALQAQERAFGVEARLDAEAQLTVELAIDAAASESSTWILGTLAAAEVVSLDGQLASVPGHGHHVAAELLPAGVEVEGVMRRYDRAADAAPAFPAGAAGEAAERQARSTEAHVLTSMPARLELRLDSPQARLDLETQMRPTEWFDLSVREGTQLVPGPAAILPAPGVPTELAAWVSFQHSFADHSDLWKAFVQDARPRAEYVVLRDTEVTIIPGAPDPMREVQTTGVGPSTLLTDVQVDSIVLARVDRLRGIEASHQTAHAAPGTRATQRVVALWASEDWELRLRALHLENGQPTDDLIEGGLTRLGPRTQLLLTPEAWNTENGRLHLTVRAILHDATTELVLRGQWARGFPRVEWPTDTPTLTGDPSSPRPSGVTAVDAGISLRGWVKLQRERHWEEAPDDVPQYPVPSPVFRATDAWELEAPRGLDARGWALRDRPPRAAGAAHPFVTYLADAVAAASGPTVRIIKGGVRYPEYGPGAAQDQGIDNVWFMRPGESATPHSAAVVIDGVRRAELSTEKLCDNEAREVPVFVSDDSASYQTGATVSAGKLALGSAAGPGTLEMVGWEVEDWQDSPPLDRYTALAVNLDGGTPEHAAWSVASEVRQLPGKRPTAKATTTISSGVDVNDPSGPALGPGSFTYTQFDTAANPWAPVFKTIAASLMQAPGFVRLESGKFLNIAHFPDGSSPGLSTGGWDRGRAFTNEDHSTAQLLGWASGPLAGTITVTGADFRRSSSGRPASFDRSPHFDLSIIEAAVTASLTGPVDLSQAPFAMLTSASGPPGHSDGKANDDTSSSLGFYARRNVLTLDGTILSGALYGRRYTVTEPVPVVTVDDDTLVLTLTDFSGRLSVQKRDALGTTIFFLFTQAMAAVAVAFFAIAWIPGVGVAAALILAEAALVMLLQKTSPIIVDDCSGGWHLTPRPSTDLSVLAPYAEGWDHDALVYNWDLNEVVWLIGGFLFVDYLNREYGWTRLGEEINELLH